MATTHVLAIDDDPAMRQLVAEYLGKNDLQVTTVATGAEMLQALHELAIELVGLDLRLASEDGMQLVRVLSPEQLLDLSRLNGAEVYDRSVDVQILRLRRKIEPDPARPQYIRTERGAGYVFSVAVQALN